MSRGIGFGIVALCFLVGQGVSAKMAADPRCPQAMVELVALYQSASVRRTLDNPVHVWAIGAADTDAFHRFVVGELEDRVLELFRIPPEDRSDALEVAALDLHISRSGMQSILDYYAAIVFEEPRLSSSPESFWPRVEELNRALRIT